MSESIIVNVNELNFDEEVILYSLNNSVLINFWAKWSKQSLSYKVFLEDLAFRLNGQIRLAHIDIDESPLLAAKFSIHKLPTVKLMFQEQLIGELVGIQPEHRILHLLSLAETAIDPSLLDLEKANALLTDGDYQEAEQIYLDILEEKPGNPDALYGYAKTLLLQQQPFDALYVLKDFPASKWYRSAELLIPLAQAQIQLKNNTLPAESDLDMAYRTAVRFTSENKFYLAIDGLLEILKQNRHYQNGSAHKLVLALLEILPDEDPSKRSYRSELASILF